MLEPTSAELRDYLFDLRGYLLLERAVDAGLIARLNQTLDEFPALEWGQWHGNVQRFDNNGACGLELQNIVEGGQPFEELIDHPSWIELLRRYCGESDSYVQGLFIDECFASIRRSGGFFPIHSGGYHGAVRGQYRYANNVFRCGQVNILLALTDVGPGDGGTMIVPGSHKSNFPHPQAGHQGQMDELVGVVEVTMKAGDALLFVDGISHGASTRTNSGERRVCIYRYGASWGATRYGYRYSEELLGRLTPERRAILEPITPRAPAKKST
ncbi:MAG: phytanoyl-CoA dioxygenase family protein [Capsulimonadaceae bacterium]|nr:phytanoyl-CoA dioxygenase family protein [Capsulimonadaceae bacterium]